MPDFQLQPSWSGRGWAAGRILLFGVVFIAITICIGWLFGKRLSHVHGAFSRPIVRQAMLLLTVLLSTGAMAKLERRKFGQFGLRGCNAVRNGLLGFGYGAAALTLLLLALAACGAFSFGLRLEFGLDALRFAMLHFLLFTLVAIQEETLFRGYLLVNLSKAISFWPAILVLSILFSMTHLGNEGENRIGIISLIVFSIVVACSFRWSGSLWFAIGMHTSWDYCQSFVFGVPNSGVLVPGRLMNPVISGPDWLTGGAVGPEASLLMLIVFGITIFVIRYALGKQSSEHPVGRIKRVGGRFELATPDPLPTPSLRSMK